VSKDLKDRENFINKAFREKDLELTKLAKEQGYSPQKTTELRQSLRDTMNQAKARATSELGDGLDTLNSGGGIKIAKNAATEGAGKFKRTLSMLGKKAAGVIPLAGAGMAALSGDPAMAAEELAGDIPVVGQAYEALKPDVAGESSEDERIMLAEDKARKNYKDSPAAKNAKLAKLKALMGNK